MSLEEAVRSHRGQVGHDWVAACHTLVFVGQGWDGTYPGLPSVAAEDIQEYAGVDHEAFDQDTVVVHPAACMQDSLEAPPQVG